MATIRPGLRPRPPTNMTRPASRPILTRLPPEVVQMIAAHLPADALANLRLACKELERKTLWYFTATYFRHIKFMHSKYALKALVAMSRSRMAQYVRALSLGPPSDDLGAVVFVAGKTVSTAKKERVLSAMWKYSEDNRNMRTFAKDLHMIRTAFQNLPAIARLDFLRALQCDCGECAGSSLVGSDFESYGQNCLYEKVGAGLARFSPRGLDSSQSIARLFTISLYAAEAAGLRLETVNAHMSDLSHGAPGEFGAREPGFECHPLDYPLARRDTVAHDSAFASLSVLRLYIGYHMDICNLPRRERFIHRTVSFLERAPALHTFGLTFGDIHGAVPFLEGLVRSGILDQLRRLELCGMIAPSTALSSILFRLRGSLQEIKLYDNLISDNKWIDVLVWLRDNMTELKEIDFYYSWGHPKREASYKGDSMKDFLDRTIELWAEMEDDTGSAIMDSDVSF